MKKTLLTISLLFALSMTGYAQKIAVKTNALGWGFYGTINAGVEVAIAPRWTLDVDGFYNPWSYKEYKKTEFWGVQPELRYWFCHKYSGHFLGLHGQYADYDYGMKRYNYKGWLAGAGLSYGYSLPIAYRWRVEGNIGVGWNRLSYDKSERWTMRDKQLGSIVWYDPVEKDRFGITRAGISVIFIIR